MIFMSQTEDTKKAVADTAESAKQNAKETAEQVKNKAADAASEAKEDLKDVADNAKSAAKDVAEDVKESAKEAVESTKKAASQAYEKAKDGLHAVEKEISPAIDDLTARAQAFCSKGIDFCAESSDKARRQFQHAAECTTRYVVEQPGKSILMAAAAGAMVAAAFLMGRRR